MRGLLTAIEKTLRQNEHFLLISHVNPDGDTLGSMLALALALETMGKDVIRYSPGGVPDCYRFLPGAERVVRSLPDRLPPCAIAIDCGDLNRAGDFAERSTEAGTLINIDHHPSNSGFGRINWIDPLAAAVGMMLYTLFKRMGVELTRDLAVCLYTAVITDTGSFRYSNTSPKVHEVTAELLKTGICPHEIAEEVFEKKPLSAVRLLQEALQTLEISEQGDVAWLTVTDEMIRRTGVDRLETEGLINYPRSIKGVEVALLFTEQAEGVKVGFRSKRFVDVQKIARQFGGGGHVRAAGCLIRKSLGEVRNEVLNTVLAAVAEGRK